MHLEMIRLEIITFNDYAETFQAKAGKVEFMELSTPQEKSRCTCLIYRDEVRHPIQAKL